MIPRLHRRGNSFKGLLNYVLHDVGKETSERVTWVETSNLMVEAKYAYYEMMWTYKNRAALKQKSGADSRGRDNKTPVFHYTLAWREGDNPTEEHIRAAAFESLKALGLSEHEVVIARHSDKKHPHVHVVVNTVHPYTGRTAALKFTKLEFSRWAEAYEKEHGIHCEQRVKNNERRRAFAKLRETERERTALALLTGKKPPEPMPFEPINDNSPNRRRWLERKDIMDRLKALNVELTQEQKEERGQSWAKQVQEREALDARTKDLVDRARAQVRNNFKENWRDLYKLQKADERTLREKATHTFERAVFVFRRRDRLGDRGKPLTLHQMVPLILSKKRLKARLEQTHMRERRVVARQEKALAREVAEQAWQRHRTEFNALRERQAQERAAERAHHRLERSEVSFAKAKDQLLREQSPQRAAPKAPSIPGPAQKRSAHDKHQPDARSVLMRDEKPPGKAPVAPEKAIPQKQKAADKNRAEATAGKPNDMSEKARKEFMKKAMERWNRRRPKDDFERER